MRSARAPASFSSGGPLSLVTRESALVRHLGAFLLFCLAFALWFHAVLVHPGERMPCCVSDGTSTIRDFWVAGAQHDNPLTFTHDFFNGAPEGSPRATATVFANAGLQTLFLWGLGLKSLLGTVGAWNLFLALGLVGTATAMFALLQRLGCTLVASLYGGYVLGFSPYSLERAYAGHLGLLQNWVLVLVVLAMIRMTSRRSVRSGALAGAAIGLAFWVTAYQGLFAVAIAFAFVLVDLVRSRTRAERRRSLVLLPLAYGVAAAMLVPIFVLYARERSTVRASTARASSDLYTFAARISDYLVPSPRNPMFHWVRGAFPRGLTEHALFIGYASLVLAAAGVALLARGDTWLRSSETRLRTATSMAVLAAIAFLFSLPPSYHAGSLRIPMPSAALGHFTTNWRVYSRFGELVALALVVLAAIALSALSRRPGRGWRLLAPAALVLVFLELLPGNMQAFDTRKGPAWVEWLASEPHGIVATYPVSLHQGPAQGLSQAQLTYQLIDHDPGFEIVGKSYLQARSRNQAIRTLALELRRPLTAQILMTEGVRYVVVADDLYRAQGARPPRPDPRWFTLLKRLGSLRIYSVHAPRVDLEKAIDAHQGEIANLQGGLFVPSVGLGSGFNPSEPYHGATGSWMTQDGALRVENDDDRPLQVVITAVAFSNGRPRAVELHDASAGVVTRATVPTYAVPLRLGPVTVGTGTTTLTLVATPGPGPLGPSDPREASVFLTQVDVTPVLDRGPGTGELRLRSRS